MTRVAVTGGREYADVRRVAEALDAIPGISVLIHGAASGADTLAAEWARRRGIPEKSRPADWDDIDTPPVRIGVTRDGKPYNKLAGFNRNVAMLRDERPDILVVFPGGRGTQHCHREALKLGIPTVEVHP